MRWERDEFRSQAKGPITANKRGSGESRPAGSAHVCFPKGRLGLAASDFASEVREAIACKGQVGLRSKAILPRETRPRPAAEEGKLELTEGLRSPKRPQQREFQKGSASERRGRGGSNKAGRLGCFANSVKARAPRLPSRCGR